MAICKFWQQGNCKFGDLNILEIKVLKPTTAIVNHQTDLRSRVEAMFIINLLADPVNRLADLQHVTQEIQEINNRRVIDSDLKYERPIWIMSAYGPGRNAPVQLFGGPEIEQSPEEIRCLHYQALATGNIQQSAQIEAQLAEKSNQQVKMVLGDLAGAMRYLQNGENQHPNRIDICESQTTHTKPNGAFSIMTRNFEIREERRKGQQPQQSGRNTSSGFVQPPPPNNTPAPVPNTGFNANPGFSSQGSTPGFGSNFGQQQNQPQPTNPSFAPIQTQGFGNSISQQPQINNFGPTPTPFSQQPAMNTMGALNPQQMQIPNGPINQSPLPVNNSPFGQPQPQGLFGQPNGSQPNGMFGSTSQPQPQSSQSPFGTSFSQPQNSNPSSNSFGGHRPDNVANGVQLNMSSVTNSTDNNNTQLSAADPAPSNVAAYSTRSGDRLQTWKGQYVQYVEDNVPCFQRHDGSLERVWFANGPPVATQANSMEDTEYSDTIVGAYEYLKENGNFKDMLVPEIAPKLGMLRWDV